jgi:hypothetical protein
MRRRLTGGTHFSERYRREGRRYYSVSDGCFDSELAAHQQPDYANHFLFGQFKPLVVLVRTCEDEQLWETTRLTKPGIFLETETAAVNPVLAMA